MIMFQTERIMSLHSPCALLPRKLFRAALNDFFLYLHIYLFKINDAIVDRSWGGEQNMNQEGRAYEVFTW